MVRVWGLWSERLMPRMGRLPSPATARVWLGTGGSHVSDVLPSSPFLGGYDRLACLSMR